MVTGGALRGERRSDGGQTAAAATTAADPDVPDVDPRFDAAILRCLARRPEDRFAQVADVVADLDAPRVRRSNRPWNIIATSVAAIALAVAVAGVFYWRSYQTTPLTDKDTIVLADFVNTTGDGVFDSTLKQALAIQLQQSPFLSLVSDERLRRPCA